MSTPDKNYKSVNNKMQKSLVISIGAAVLCCVASLLVSTASAQNGTWSAYPGQSATYAAAVQQPINVDGSSNFKANGKAVIPVKFALFQGLGPFVFESICSDTRHGQRLLVPEFRASRAGDVPRHHAVVGQSIHSH